MAGHAFIGAAEIVGIAETELICYNCDVSLTGTQQSLGSVNTNSVCIAFDGISGGFPKQAVEMGDGISCNLCQRSG